VHATQGTKRPATGRRTTSARKFSSRNERSSHRQCSANRGELWPRSPKYEAEACSANPGQDPAPGPRAGALNRDIGAAITSLWFTATPVSSSGQHVPGYKTTLQKNKKHPNYTRTTAALATYHSTPATTCARGQPHHIRARGPPSSKPPQNLIVYRDNTITCARRQQTLRPIRPPRKPHTPDTQTPNRTQT